MDTLRQIRWMSPSRPTREGAGVQLRRAFGHGQEEMFDPFLMLDDFRADHPSQYEAGFPWHPHRGIETITYMLEGEVDHGDSMGNSGTIGPGDVQWMTAGSGIVHQEMPRGDRSGRMGGFQLWANLPARQKMIDPRYRGITAHEIPVEEARGSRVRVISGRVGSSVGPVREVVIEPEYLDVTLDPGTHWAHDTQPDHTVFAYLFEGAARFGDAVGLAEADRGVVVLFTGGSGVSAETGQPGCRFLLVAGRPLREPVAWRGPIVMNTREELDTAWRELDEGTFVKHGDPRKEQG